MDRATLIRDVLGGASKAVVTVGPGETIRDAVDLLNENGIGAVVVTVDTSTIVGILSERDVVRHLGREQEGTLRLRVEDLMTGDVEVCRLDDLIESTMAQMIAGSAEKLQREPFVSFITLVISPFKIDEIYGDMTCYLAREGLPVVVPTEPICGTTSPVTLAGNVLTHTAETLAGIALVQCVNRGAPGISGSRVLFPA